MIRTKSFAPKRLACAFGLAALALAAGATRTQNAIANGDTRTLTLHHAHTKEDLTVTYKRDGVYDRSALEKLNWFLRDWRREEKTTMDPRLFDTLWATYREVGSGEPIKIVSAYRSPETNSMLRRRSRGVAKHSQHTMGRAIDLHMPDVSMAKVREIGMRLHNGGVGYYPTAGTPFVHLDVGTVRSWPRMPRHQLERLFPDGKTVHLPADGEPLAGYQIAAAEIERRGGEAASYADVTGPRKSLWATLFGGEDEEEAAPRRGGRAVAQQRGSRGAGQQSAAVNPNVSVDSGSVYSVASVAAQPEAAPPVVRAAPRVRPPVERPEAEAPKPATAVAAAPQPAQRRIEDEDAPKIAAAPLPPRRPGDLTFAALAAAAVPLPPARPKGEEAEAQPPVVVAANTTAREPELRPANVPLPVPRPATPEPAQVAAVSAQEPAPRLASVPQPTPRPVAFAAQPGPAALDRNALPAAITGSVAAGAAPGLALAPANVPVPQPRPATASPRPDAARPATSDAVAPGKYDFRLDSAAMDSLIAGVSAQQDKPKRTEKVAMPGVRQTYGSAIVAGKFGAAPAEAGRFSGSLVRPLNAGFVKRGE